MLDFTQWKKIDGLNLYYIGKWAEPEKYVNIYRMIHLTKKDYDKIIGTKISSDKKFLEIDFGDGVENREIIKAELFRSEL